MLFLLHSTAYKQINNVHICTSQEADSTPSTEGISPLKYQPGGAAAGRGRNGGAAVINYPVDLILANKDIYEVGP